jgi:thymidylate synthase
MFGAELEFDIRHYGFPLLTTKNVYWKGVIGELLWFLNGKTDANILKEKKINIWNGNSSREYLDSIGLQKYEEGDCGPIYGFQWRHWNAPYINYHTDYNGKGVDQIARIIHELKTNKYSRRLFMTAWNPEQLDEMCLPPCHVSYQFYAENDEFLSVKMYQRSADVFLGLPFNIASTAALLSIIAEEVGMKPARVLISVGDAHIYEEHLDAVKTQIRREPYMFPELKIKLPEIHTQMEVKKYKFENYTEDNFEIVNYSYHPTIKAKMIA